MAMMLELLAMKPPVLQVVPKGANFSVYGHVNFHVLDANRTTHLAFTLGVVSSHSVFFVSCNEMLRIYITEVLVAIPQCSRAQYHLHNQFFYALTVSLSN